MNRKWNEKTTVEKVADIIATIFLCLWAIFNVIDSINNSDKLEFASTIAITIVCISEAVSYWNVKRSFSYVAIGGAVLILATIILGATIFA